MRLDTLTRALDRARRLYATSNTTASDDAADELEVYRCRHCRGNILVAHPSRGSLYLGPVEVLNDGGCEICDGMAGAWRVLDLALSPTAARLRAGTRVELCHAYGVDPEHRRNLAAQSEAAPDPRRVHKESSK